MTGRSDGVIRFYMYGMYAALAMVIYFGLAALVQGKVVGGMSVILCGVAIFALFRLMVQVMSDRRR